MNYVNVEQLNKALDEIGKYCTADTMAYINANLRQGIQDFYDKQSENLTETDLKALGIEPLNTESFDEAPW